MITQESGWLPKNRRTAHGNLEIWIIAIRNKNSSLFSMFNGNWLIDFSVMLSFTWIAITTTVARFSHVFRFWNVIGTWFFLIDHSSVIFTSTLSLTYEIQANLNIIHMNMNVNTIWFKILKFLWFFLEVLWLYFL